MKKYLFGIMVLGLILNGCAPGTFSGSSKSGWAKLIFAPSKSDVENTCTRGANSQIINDLGGILIKTQLGEISFQAGVGWFHNYCSYIFRLTKKEPDIFIPVSSITVNDALTPMNKILVRVILEGSDNKEIGILEPDSTTKASEGSYAFGFYSSLPTKEILQLLDQAVAFRFQITRNDKTEFYRFTQQEYSALGTGVVR
jgi:hypothetical protein